MPEAHRLGPLRPGHPDPLRPGHRDPLRALAECAPRRGSGCANLRPLCASVLLPGARGPRYSPPPTPSKLPRPPPLCATEGGGQSAPLASFPAYLCPSQPASSAFLKDGRKGRRGEGARSPFPCAPPRPRQPAPYLGTSVASAGSTAPATRGQPGAEAAPPGSRGKPSSKGSFRVKRRLENTSQGVVSL